MIQIAKLYAPLVAPKMPELPPSEGDVSALVRRPVLSPISWISLSNGSSTVPGFVSVTVGAPTLVNVLNVYPLLSTSERCRLELFWRPSGDPTLEREAGRYGGELYRQRFRGPFAYLPRAGDYDLCAHHARSGDGAQDEMVIQAELVQGVTPADIAFLNHDGGSFEVGHAANATSLAFTPVIPDVHSSFVRYRTARIQNQAASVFMQVRVGRPNDGADFTILAGETLTLGPNELGRSTLKISANSPFNQLYNATINLW